MMPRTPPLDSSTPCRLIVDGPAVGAWNMAVDETLLESAAEHGLSTLRFYEWSAPTLSLGYFQSFAQRSAHAASAQCACVRRQTGGGAILHDQELTYSLALPVASPLAADARRLYEIVHNSLIGALSSCGVNAQCCQESADMPVGNEPFLCFERRSRGDVLLGNAKIAGSAQRRRRGGILEHGSLLLAASDWTPELPGILELSGQRLTAAEAVRAWRQRLSAALCLKLQESSLSAGENRAAAALKCDKYGHSSWNQRR